MTDELVPRDVAESWKAKAENLSLLCKERADRIEQQAAEIARLNQQLAITTAQMMDAEEEGDRLKVALAFYADPETYHGCAFMFDHPTGGFDEDFSEDHGHEDYKRPMPGRQARAALGGSND